MAIAFGTKTIARGGPIAVGASGKTPLVFTHTVDAGTDAVLVCFATAGIWPEWDFVLDGVSHPAPAIRVQGDASATDLRVMVWPGPTPGVVTVDLAVDGSDDPDVPLPSAIAAAINLSGFDASGGGTIPQVTPFTGDNQLTAAAIAIAVETDEVTAGLPPGVGHRLLLAAAVRGNVVATKADAGMASLVNATSNVAVAADRVRLLVAVRALDGATGTFAWDLDASAALGTTAPLAFATDDLTEAALVDLTDATDVTFQGSPGICMLMRR